MCIASDCWARGSPYENLQTPPHRLPADLAGATGRLQASGRVIESYHSSMDSFLTAEGGVVSEGAILLKRELLVDPHQRLDSLDVRLQ